MYIKMLCSCDFRAASQGFVICHSINGKKRRKKYTNIDIEFKIKLLSSIKFEIESHSMMNFLFEM